MIPLILALITIMCIIGIVIGHVVDSDSMKISCCTGAIVSVIAFGIASTITIFCQEKECESHAGFVYIDDKCIKAEHIDMEELRASKETK